MEGKEQWKVPDSVGKSWIVYFLCDWFLVEKNFLNPK